MMRRSFGLFLLTALLVSGCAGALSSAAPSPMDIDTGVDPEAWALVPAGEFFYSRHAHETMIDYDYEVMVTDVTNAQFAAYLNEALEAGAVKIEADAVVGYYPGDEFHAYEHEEVIAAGDWLHIPLDESLDVLHRKPPRQLGAEHRSLLGLGPYVAVVDLEACLGAGLVDDVDELLQSGDVLVVVDIHSEGESGPAG